MTIAALLRDGNNVCVELGRSHTATYQVDKLLRREASGGMEWLGGGGYGLAFCRALHSPTSEPEI